VVASEPDLTDALDFDAALSAEAEQLALGGSTESVDVRRAMAVGEIARQQLALDLRAAGGEAGKPRQVVLYVHLSEAALCGNRDTEVIVKPVVDLNEHIASNGYQFLRDHHGTVDVTSERPPPKPEAPQHFC
jgi:hypothetical protein